MDNIIALILCFSFCVLSIKLVKPFALKFGLVDIPNDRKRHNGHIPLIGGVAIYLAIFMSSLFYFDYTLEYFVYLSSALMILFLGMFDDKYDLSVKVRVVFQIFIASLMVFVADLHFESFGNILGFGELQLGKIGIFLTIIAVIASINAFNMVDGIDGLAGALSFIAFSGLTALLLAVNNEWYLISALFVAAISAFLMFNLNWPKRSYKIFMGDAGSMLIGFTIIWLLVVGTKDSVNAFHPVTALYLIAIPLMDMVAIMYRRAKKGMSPFKADRDHLHHIFERAGYSRKQSLLIISLIALVLAFAGVFMQFLNVPEWLMFILFITLFLIYNYILAHIWRILSWIRRH